MKIHIHNRYLVLFNYILIYCLIGFFIRTILLILSIHSLDFTILNFAKIYGLGIIYDFGTAIFFSFFYGFYLLILPSRFTGSIFDKFITYVVLFFTFFVTVFSFLAEFPFWDEFNTRFNFIAVDYLIYTYEVFENINQSFSLNASLTLTVFTVIAALAWLINISSLIVDIVPKHSLGTVFSVVAAGSTLGGIVMNMIVASMVTGPSDKPSGFLDAAFHVVLDPILNAVQGQGYGMWFLIMAFLHPMAWLLLKFGGIYRYSTNK